MPSAHGVPHRRRSLFLPRRQAGAALGRTHPLASRLIQDDATPYWQRRIERAWREAGEAVDRIDALVAAAKADPRCRFHELRLSPYPKP